MEQDAILAALSRIIADKEFRTWFASNPKEALATLGLSRTAVDLLVRVAPTIAAVAITGILLDSPKDIINFGYRDR